MNTSFFDNYSGVNAVSIAGKCPEWYNGKEYRKLAPKYWWWKKWHNKELTNKEYIQMYYKTVLNFLNPSEVYNELGKCAVLLCWEIPTEFCHRHIVAEWIQNELGIFVPELKKRA